MTQDEIKELGAIDILDKYEELIKEEAMRPKSFNQEKREMFCLIYDEIISRLYDN